MTAETHQEVYRPFVGQLEERRWRGWPIFASGLRTALKQRRALLLLYAPPAIATVIFSFVVYLSFAIKQEVESEEPFELQPGIDLKEQLGRQVAKGIYAEGLKLLEVTNQIIEFNKAMAFFAVLAVAWFGSGLFCEDRKAGAHQLYFSRPITRLDYYTGKFATASFFSLCAMLVPMLVICIVASVTSPEWSFVKEQWDVFPRGVAFSLVWTAAVVSVVLLSSSLASRKGFALIGVFAFFFLSEAISNALGFLADRRFLALSLMRDLNAIGYALFDRPDPWTEVSAHLAWGFVLGLIALASLVIGARLRRLEVVA